ncbi:hypothetical protein Poli38472_000878 [Pythium oligandrum]|uniref:Uncharacterized protein n=1 Tax=Pythium oligandrum TaxID=41045 RepID=A0A8K1CDD2_PYTOL|nr:hypothetical protein Poli38472_000878 [Pythium oligandrum]|eukprot:TMW60836.1 hypothetical protein Poli38472_000878 [Pythium oligandrum]
MMVCHGIFILVVSVFSSGVFWTFPDIPLDCIHRVYPRFSKAEACGGRIINCTHAGISGNKSEFTAVLELFDDASLEFLIVLDCSNLQLPSTIQRFHQLNTLKITDATLSEWNEDASLSTDAFPVIMTLRLWNITLECSPYGLYRVPVSSSLEWFSFENIDLSGFIGEVGSNWKDLQYVYFDATHIDQVPEAVATMSKALELSLRFNAISVVNGSRLTSLNQLTGLWFDGNPITALPDEAWRHSTHLQEFGFQYTSVATYPSWANSVTNKELQFNGFDSPLCDPSNKAYAVGKLDYLACIENFYGYN